MITQTTIGARLRGVIWFRREKITGFAASISTPYRTLQNYLRDERKPGPDHLARLAGAGVDIAWLVTGRYRGALSGGEWVDAPAAYALGDAAFVGRLLQRIQELVDEFHDRQLDAGEDPLRSHELEAALDVYRGVCLRTLIEKAETIQELAVDGADTDKLLGIVTMPLTPELLDERLRRAVAEAGSRAPRRLPRADRRFHGEPAPEAPPEADAGATPDIPPTGDWSPPRPERAELAARISEYAEQRGISFREAMVEFAAVHGTDPTAPRPTEESC